ncbi:MAG: glycosyltransferase family 4 protein, partial [Thermoanaerobaculia bacterium]
MAKLRALFVAVHRPNRSPGQRFRFEQYLSYLRGRDIDCTFSFLLDETDDAIFYGSSDTVGKAALAGRAILKRANEAIRLLLEPSYDVVFVFREALFFGPPFFEEAVARSRAKLIFDLDDAIWIPTVSEGNRRFAFLRFTEKVDRIMSRADRVLGGCRYIADYAKKWNSQVEVVPTTIDTIDYRRQAAALPGKQRSDDRICIGWSGSVPTSRYFQTALPVLRRIKERFGDRVRFSVVGDGSFRDAGLGIEGRPWRADTEVADLCDMDIGLMPMPDEEFAYGKCGLKGLQYMSLGVAAVMSPIGVNSEIVQHGVNGFVPAHEDEWVECLSRLVEDPSLREKFRTEGQRTVDE